MDASSSSSSSSSLPRWNYDVFLSFRGKDTRKSFVDHLYMALQNKGIYTFKDDEKLRRGKLISPELLKAIKESELAIIIFSKNYASSSWCLDELVQIIECKKAVGQKVLPIFYDIDPSQVREQKGSFAKAFAKHEEFTFGEDKEKVQRWRTALVEAANLSGWNLNNIANGHEAKFIKKIVQDIIKVLGPASLHVGKYQVGIDFRMNKVITLLENGLKDVCIVGICGSGGIGKTAIVKVVFNQIKGQFESCCFLSNVREVSEQHGLTYLQQQLLNDILMEEDLKIWNVDYGIRVIKKRLRYKKVLVVLDDVDSLKQLESLVGENDWFGFGSRIIITTRNERLLVEHKVDHEIYNVELLNDDEALQLFSWHAFTSNHPLEEYLKLSQSVINYAQGLPLAIQVLGSFLYKRSKKEWEDELNNLKRIPNKEICDILKISFDGLNDTEKDLFLDISCFFKDNDKDYVMDILGSSGFHPRIQVLFERSLITISRWNKLEMHDLIQEMGKEVVRRESPDDPGRRSRLWFYEDIYKVLRENTVTETIKGIMLNMPHDHLQEELHVNTDVFVKMKKIKLLKLSGIRSRGCLTFPSNELSYLDWDGYPTRFLPSNFLPKNLVHLRLCHNQIKEISSSVKFLEKLKFLDLSESLYLYKTPDLSSLPCLEELNLERCTNLIEVHRSFGVHERLVCVNLRDCKNLRSFPRSIKLKNLKYFFLWNCSKLEKFPEIEGPMDCLENLELGKTAIKDLPSSIEHLKGLQHLSLEGCSKLKSVPSNIFSRMKDLEILYIGEGETAIEHLPPSPKKPNSLMPFSFVQKRTLVSTSYLQSELLSSCLSTLKYLNIRKSNLSEKSFPNDIGGLSSLETLDLRENNFSTIPASLIQLTNLETLYLNDCTSLRTLTSLPSSIHEVVARGCKSLERYWIPPSVGSPKYRNFIFSGCDKLLVMDQRNNMPNILSQSQLQGIGFIFLPGSEIPQWFSNKSEVEGWSSSMSLVVHHHHQPSYNNIKGIAVCVAFQFQEKIPVFEFLFKINGYDVIEGREIWYSLNSYFVDFESDHVMLMNIREYFDHESKGYQPIKNLMKKRPKCSPGPPNISDDDSYIEASLMPLYTDRKVKMKKMGIHLVTEEQAQVE